MQDSQINLAVETVSFHFKLPAVPAVWDRLPDLIKHDNLGQANVIIHNGQVMPQLLLTIFKPVH